MSPNPDSAYPTGEHSSIRSNPASASSFIVPAKSFAISVRTGHVWQPMGIPSGLARSDSPRVERIVRMAVWVAVHRKKSRLDRTIVVLLLDAGCLGLHLDRSAGRLTA